MCIWLALQQKLFFKSKKDITYVITQGIRRFYEPSPHKRFEPWTNTLLTPSCKLSYHTGLSTAPPSCWGCRLIAQLLCSTWEKRWMQGIVTQAKHIRCHPPAPGQGHLLHGQLSLSLFSLLSSIVHKGQLNERQVLQDWLSPDYSQIKIKIFKTSFWPVLFNT